MNYQEAFERNTDPSVGEGAGLDGWTDWTHALTVGDVLVRGAHMWPLSDAVVLLEERMSYQSLLLSAKQMARSLLGLGVGQGERVGILMPNCLQFVEVFFACQLIGAVPVPINARFKSRELAYVIENADLVAVVTSDVIAQHASFVDLLSEAVQAIPQTTLRHLILLGETRSANFLGDSELARVSETIEPSDIDRRRHLVRIRDAAVMIYTSGTTANPKGCPLTNEALTRTAIALAERYKFGPSDRMWNPLPLFHGGAMIPLISLLYSGGAFCTMTRFDATAALRQIAREQCTFLYPAFPTIIQSLVHHPAFRETDLTSVRALQATGAEDAIRRVQKEFAPAAVVTSYGLTETGGITASSAPDEDIDDRVNCGRPFRGMEVRVVDPESGRNQHPGMRGEICVRGVGMFEGYHKDPMKTARTVDVEGWFHTGDLGTVDQKGRVTFLGRSKDMLKVGGENVAAIEIEAYLQEHPAVKVAQVVGVPDERLLEVPAAYVEILDGHTATENELIEFCRGKIASFKVPRYIRFTSEWPMSATKIQKVKLRLRIMEELGLEE
jgi:fatty-acyl-CoA synthase